MPWLCGCRQVWVVRFVTVLLLQAAILVPAVGAAEAARSRPYHSERPINRILILLVTGLIGEIVDPHEPERLIGKKIDELLSKASARNFDFESLGRMLLQLRRDKTLNTGKLQAEQIELRVDGERQYLGFGAIKNVVWRLLHIMHSKAEAGSADASPGSIRLNYQIRIRGALVVRETLIEDGRVRLTTTIQGGIPRVSWARLVSDAREFRPDPKGNPRDRDTMICNTMSACVPIGRFQRGPITLVIQRVMSRKLDGYLCLLEREVVGLAENGYVSLLTVSDKFIELMTGDGLRAVP